MAIDDHAILMRAPLFKALGHEITQSIVQNRRARIYERGEQIFSQGDDANFFFVVIEGWVAVYRQREGGNQVVLEIFGAGETFAEAAMFLGGRYPASAEASSPARVLHVDGGALRRAIVQQPQMAFDMLAAASLHLKQMIGQIEQLKSQSAPQKIVNFLLDRIDTTTGPATLLLPFEKSLIANRLGMTPESFSRALVTLRARGVSADRDYIHIADVGDLAKFAERKCAAAQS